MMEEQLVLTACILLAFFTSPGHCCRPAEIGTQYTITSTANVPSSVIVSWQFRQINVSEIILFDSSLKNQTVYPNLYNVTRTQLTILNISLDDGLYNFSHIVNGTLVYSCKLPLYKKAKKPECENMTLNGNEIRITCTTDEVFPQAKCDFTLQKEGIDKWNITDRTSSIAYTHTNPKQRDNKYYSTSCTLLYNVTGLKPGNWTIQLIQVNMYPDLTGVTLNQGTIGQADNIINLSVPTVSIDSNTCPNGLAGEDDTNVRQGYIRQGERASCLCSRARAGNPPGKIDWSSTQGGAFDILSENEDEAVIQINSMDTFACQSSSVLNGSHNMTYEPKYAYGPSSASLIFPTPEPIYLCPSQQTHINITCQVPENSFSPANIFTIWDGNKLITKVPGMDAQSKSVSYNYTQSGQHTFTCRVENAIFNDIFIDAAASTIEVYGPPSEPPKISARSIQHGDILVDGDDVIVTCDVSGGYPVVQSVTLTCDQNNSVSNNGTTAQLTLNDIGPVYNGTNCTCQATHITGCYDLMGVLLLTVLNETLAPSGQEDSPPIGVAVGVAIGTFALIAVVVVGVIVFIRRKQKKQKQKEQYRAHAEDYNPQRESWNWEVTKTNEVYGFAVPAKDYTAIQPTITSATAFPKKYRPDNIENPYEDVNPEELKRESLARESMDQPLPGAKPVSGAKPVLAVKPLPGAKPIHGAKPVPATKPVPGAKPNVPKTSVETKSAPEPCVQNEDVYATVERAGSQHSKNLITDQPDETTKVLAPGESPQIPKRLYNIEDLRDSVNEPQTNADHTYTDEAFDHQVDGNTYANTGKA